MISVTYGYARISKTGHATQSSRRRDQRFWQRIRDNRNASGVSQWVISTFAGMPGSHGTRLIDYPEQGISVRFKGRTYRCQIHMDNQSWQVYRRLKKRAIKRSGLRHKT